MNLSGKNVERRRDGDDWFYRFRLKKKRFSGSCGTTDKSKAEALAAQLKQETRQAIRSNPRATAMARAAIAKGEPFVLLTASGNCISNIDRRDLAALLREQLARLED